MGLGQHVGFVGAASYLIKVSDKNMNMVVSIALLSTTFPTTSSSTSFATRTFGCC